MKMRGTVTEVRGRDDTMKIICAPVQVFQAMNMVKDC